MPAWIELVLLAIALAVAIYLGVDLGRRWARQRHERRHLEHLGASEAQAESTDRQLSRFDRRLRGAGLRVGPVTWLAGSVLFGVLVFFAVFEMLSGDLIAATLAALLSAWLPWSLVGAWARRRARLFEEKLVDAVAFMTSALQTGENPTRALMSAAEAAEGPVALELRRISDGLDVGMSIRQALTPMVEGYDSEGVRLFAQTLIAKWAAGGDMAPVLERVNEIMRQRLAMRLGLRSEMAGARLAAVIVALMPYLLIPVLLWRRPEWAQTLFNHPLGLQLLLSAILLQLIGILWLRRIMRFEH